jgi:CRP-like cAMP-binding protein
MSQLKQNAIKNQLLGLMSKDDFALLAEHLVWIQLAKGDLLVEPDRPIQNCWFLEAGVASVVLATPQGQETEVGIIGLEGMVDLSTVQGLDSSPFRCFVQVPGAAYRLPASTLTAALEVSPAMRGIMARFAYSFTVQVSGTALANASFTVEQRLARWLLMCHDRLETRDVALTHEFLALMLNVRRAGVTTAIGVLERAGLLDGKRGVISIDDRPGLEAFAGECYDKSEAFNGHRAT